MEFLYLLEKIRVPAIDEVMLAVTELGGELPFLVVAMIVFWCVDKRMGYYVLSAGFLGTLSNHFLKLQFRVPRPWDLNQGFTIVERAREAAAGYSFPSGHTQTAVCTFGSLGVAVKNQMVRIGCLAAVILVPFSRMYLGVHTPADVLAAAVMAVVILFVLHPVVFRRDGAFIPALLTVMLVLAAAFVFYVESFPFPADIDERNLASGLKNAYTVAGALPGLILVYIIDEKYIHFKTDAVWWAQILKIGFGFLAVLAIKSGLKEPLDALCGGHMFGRALRYFLIVIMAGVIWPLTFKWFSKLGRKN